MKEKALSLSSTHFIQNNGQMDSDEIMFYSSGGEVYFTPTGLLYRFREMEPIQDEDTTQFEIPDSMRDAPEAYHEWGVVLKYSFVEANRVVPEGKDRCSWNTNYFKGSDPEKWYTGIPNYREIWYRDLWDGIDLVYRQNEKGMKYDLILKPGANSDDIRMMIEGQDSLSISSNGDLMIKTKYWDILDSGLYTYYSDDHTEVDASFSLIEEDVYSFKLYENDITKEIVIDPALDYSTFIGGSDYDAGFSIAIDSSSNVYVTGSTNDATIDYPTTSGAYDTTNNGGWDALVTKLNSAGSSLLYSTYLGGDNYDYGNGIAIDSSGNAFITGEAGNSSKFPTTSGAYDTTHDYFDDAFVTKLNSTGSSLLYSTLIGGSRGDCGYGIAIDSSGNAFVIGNTGSTNFPTTSGAFDESHNGNGDIFVMKLNSVGSSLLYSTFIGGSGTDSFYDVGNPIAIDAAGNAYITGYSLNTTTDYPTTSSAFDTTNDGLYSVFVTKLDSKGSTLLYSTFLGGSTSDYGSGIAIDTSGNAFITGNAGSPEFPVTSNAYDTTINGGYDVFVTKLDSTGSSLLYSTFIGGSDNDRANCIAIDSRGNAYITGYTDQTLGNVYPTTKGAYDRTHNGDDDLFMSILNSTGSSLIYSTLIGGRSNDMGYGIALGGNKDVYITGYAMDNSMQNYPTTAGAYDTTHNFGFDTIVTKLVIDVDPPIFGSDLSDTTATTGDTFTFRIDVDDDVKVSSVHVEYWYGPFPHINNSMSGTGPYTYSTTVPSDYLYDLNYLFHANDTSDNWNQNVKRTVSVSDNDLPLIDDRTLDNGFTGDPLIITALVADNVGLSYVGVEYWFADKSHSTNPMSGIGVYTYSIPIPDNFTDNLHYIIRVNDTSNNWNQSAERSVKVLDDDAPEIDDLTPDKATTGKPFTFVVNVLDNLDVPSVDIEFWFGEGNHTTNPMVGEGAFSYLVPIPENYTDSLHYIIRANDTSGNKNQTEENVVTIIDDAFPYFGSDPVPTSVGTGDILLWSVHAYDNVGISSVQFEHWFGEGHHENITLGGLGDCLIELAIPEDSIDPLHYILSAVDTSGNWASIQGTIPVVDTIPPVITPIPDMVVDEDLPITFNGSDSYDNIGIVNWSWGVMWDHFGDEVVFDNHDWIGTITFVQPGYYSVWLNVTDAAGNWGVGLFCSNVTVRDITPPHIENLTFSIGEDAPIGTIYAEAEDNVGIVNWTWVFQDQGVDRLLYGRSLPYSFTIPGTYNITIRARDAAWNMASGWILLTVRDWVRPVVDAGPDRTVDEDIPVTLEGNGTDDGDIVNWTWRFVDGYDRSLYGKIVTYTFAEPGTYRVTLQVKDAAGNSMNDSLTVIVRDVIIDDGGGHGPELDGTLLWIIIALVILAVITVSIVLFFVLRKQKKPSEIVIERSEEFVIPPEPSSYEPTSAEPTPDASVLTPEPSEPTQQPPVMDEAPIEIEVDGKQKEDTVMDPDHLEDPRSSL